MKKLILFILILSACQGFSQTAYYDAIKLKSYIDKGVFIKNKDSLEKVSTILKPYLNNIPISELKANQVLVMLQNKLSPNYNPFIAPYIDLSGVQSNNFIKNITGGSSIMGMVGGLNVTNIADGLARFMVERAKEELNVAFFTRFKEEMLNPEYEDLRILFPQTFNILKLIDTDIYKYNAYLTTLREAFQQDLSNVFVNFQDVIRSDKYKPYFDKNKELKAIIESSLFIIDKLTKNMHPGDILAEYSNSEYLKNMGDSTFIGSIQTLNLFSLSLRSKSADRYWLAQDSIKLLFKDNDLITFKIYLGLIYQKGKDIKYLNNQSLGNVLKELAELDNSYEAYKNFINGFMGQANTVDGYLKEISAKEKSERSYTDYYKFFGATLDMIEYAENVKNLPYLNIKIPQEYYTYTYVARRAGDVYLDVNNKNYSGAVLNVVAVYDTLFSKVYDIDDAQVEKYLKILKDYEKKFKKDGVVAGELLPVMAKLNSNLSYSPGVEEQIQYVKTFEGKSKESINTSDKNKIEENLKNLISKFENEIHIFKNQEYIMSIIMKYGTFMSNVAKAETSGEVQAIIESTVLPAGSYRVKRSTNLNVTINSYFGASILDIPDNSDYGRYNGKIGFYGPIGLEASTALFSNSNWKSNISLFVSLIDVGSLAQFRLNNSDSTLKSDIKLANLWAPGANLIIGIPKTPIVIGVGYQLRSVMQKIEENGTILLADKNPGWGWQYYIAVDIPLFNLYTLPKKGKRRK